MPFRILLALVLTILQMPQGGVTSISGTAISQIGSANQNNVANNTASSSISVSAGDKLVAYTATAAVAQTQACADSAGDTFTATPAGQLSSSGLAISEVFYAIAGTTGSTTFSCSSTVTGSNTNIFITFRGGAASSILDTSSNATQTTVTSFTSASFTTANATEAIVLCVDSTTSPRTVGLIGGVTAAFAANSSITGTFRPSCEFLIPTSKQTGITAAMGFPSGNGGGQMAAFK